MIPKQVFAQTILDHLGPVRPFLDDASVSEVLINGPSEIFIERRGQLETTPARFDSAEALMSALRAIAQFAGRSIGPHNPILEARLPDGSRVEAVIAPAAHNGPTVAIRRFAKHTITATRLVDLNSLTAEALELIRILVEAKQNIIVAGGTASGKTSFLNAISGFVPDNERVVVIEDARELQLQQRHVVALESQPPDPRGQGRVEIRQLFKATLRLRPDRIVVGEIRGAEALDMIQAMTSGHGGCMSTVHATHPIDTLSRIETMAMMSDVGLPLAALRAQVASAINFVIHTTRLADGFRCVSHISEVAGYHPVDGYEVHDLFLREYLGQDESGKVRSRLVSTGQPPTIAAYLAGLGYQLPMMSVGVS